MPVRCVIQEEQYQVYQTQKRKKIIENWEMFEHKTCHLNRLRKENKSLTLNVTNLSFLH